MVEKRQTTPQNVYMRYVGEMKQILTNFDSIKFLSNKANNRIFCGCFLIQKKQGSEILAFSFYAVGRMCETTHGFVKVKSQLILALILT